MTAPSLRRAVKTATGQDVYFCRACQLCDIEPDEDMDVPLIKLYLSPGTVENIFEAGAQTLAFDASSLLG